MINSELQIYSEGQWCDVKPEHQCDQVVLVKGNHQEPVGQLLFISKEEQTGHSLGLNSRKHSLLFFAMAE